MGGMCRWSIGRPAKENGTPLTLNQCEHFDHSYHFVASNIDDHLRFYAEYFGLLCYRMAAFGGELKMWTHHVNLLKKIEDPHFLKSAGPPTRLSPKET